MEPAMYIGILIAVFIGSGLVWYFVRRDLE